MRYRLFATWLLLWVCFTSLEAETVRVATLNVRNYLIMDRRVDGYWRREYPKPESEKAALRAIIAKVDPDVLALQEMGKEPFLKEFQRDLKREGVDYPYSALLEGPDPERHLAVLSKLPIAGLDEATDLSFNIAGEPYKVSRGMQGVLFETVGETWSLFNLHLKSRRTVREDDPEAVRQRTGEAQAARDYILEHYPPEFDFKYLILGDLNDTRQSAPVRRMLTRGERIISEMILTEDSRGHRWTHHWAREDDYTRVDYILASPAMQPHVVEGSGSIYDGPEMAIGSDHRMVWVDLEFKAQ